MLKFDGNTRKDTPWGTAQRIWGQPPSAVRRAKLDFGFLDDDAELDY
jgi:hypothetical protein